LEEVMVVKTKTKTKTSGQKNPIGRPTSYNNSVLERAENYINGGYVAVGDVVPSRAGLAVELGVSRETLTNWGRVFPEFLGTLERLLAIQERVTLSKGLSGDFNSNIAKMLLGNHGYSDRQTIAGDKDAPLQINSTINVGALSAQALAELVALGDKEPD
jgi:hypothetical protein